MTTDNSRADALTVLQELSKWAAGFSTWQDESKGPYLSDIIADARRIVSASTSSQPAAAPIETCPVCHAKPGQWQCPKSTNDLYNAPPDAACRAAPAPSPADERAAFVERVMGMFEAWPNGKPGPTDEPESHYRFGYNTALEDVLTALDVGSPTRRAASANETGAEGAIVGAWLTEDGRAISAEQKAGMLRDGGAGASSVQPYSIPCYLGAASAMAAEAVAFEITEQAAAEWASRHDVDHVLKHFSTQRNAIEDARTLHLLAAAPQPAQAGARVGLTAEARATIMDACQSISRGADGLKAGCAIGDEWPDAEDKAFYDAELRLLARLTALIARPGQPEPIDMLLFCPKCGVQHVDAPEKASEGHPVLYADAWTNSPHRSHLCHACGTIWRPADVPTNGVAAIQTRGKADTWDGEPEPRAEVTDAARDVLDERHRQIDAEGWTPAHDDEHDKCEMALAAIVYTESAVGYHPSCPDTWPWSPKWFKPTTPRRDLVKAAALVIAEIERLDRAAIRTGASS
ncbi:Uncharacterised protein [Burkholderia pseudomallei]|nr:Uncharacterised protein [Burkholderia pseudomallei]